VPATVSRSSTSGGAGPTCRTMESRLARTASDSRYEGANQVSNSADC
jgi:hypothetical protein